MLLGILGHAAPDFDTMRSIINRLLAAVSPDSYLVPRDGVDTGDQVYAASVWTSFQLGNQYRLRTVEQFRACFEGLHLVDRFGGVQSLAPGPRRCGQP